MPPDGLLELAGRALHGAGEGAALVAEQLAFDQLARDRRHVERHERTLAALAVVVQRARHQLLAGARLAGDHHRQVGRHQARQRPVDLLHGRRAADQRQALALLRRIGVALHRRGRRRQRAVHHRDQFVEVERLGQVFEGAALGGAHRRQQRRLRAHDDDAQVGPELADARHEVEAVLVGHHHVGDDELALAFLDPLPQRRGGAGAAHIVALAAQRLVQDGADGAIVVGDQDGRGAAHGAAWRNCNGNITLKVVRPGSLSNSMAPPWSLMILATNARPRPVPVGLLVTKGVEQVGADLVGHAVAVVAHRHDQGQVDLGLLAGHGQPQAVAEGCGQLDLALALARHLAGVLHQVEEDLDELVAVAMDVGQRRIVGLDEAHALAEAVLRDAADVVQHLVDVDRAALDRPAVGERLHAVDQRHDAVGLLADQAGQLALAVRHRLLEQLRRAADARQRVLDLVRQHGGQRAHRAGGAAVRHLAVDVAGDRLLDQRHRDQAVAFDDRRQAQRAEAVADARRGKRDAVLGDGAAGRQHLLEQGEERRVVGHEFAQRMADQARAADAEELLGREVGVVDEPAGIDHHHRLRKRVEDRRRETARRARSIA